VKKSWLQKLNDKKEIQIKKIDFDLADMHAGDIMFIATPEIVNNYVKQIPKGKSVSIKTLRNDLAIEHGADSTCPLTTGIFLRIVAEAAYENYLLKNSTKGIVPFWRAIEPNSKLASKLSFGKDFLIAQRLKEGIE
jgi:hypothetical protein